MDQYPWVGYPWFTLAMTRAVLLRRLRDIENTHLRYFPESPGDPKASAALRDIRSAFQAAKTGRLELAMNIADKQLWWFYHRREIHTLTPLCIQVSNMRYVYLPQQQPVVHAV